MEERTVRDCDALLRQVAEELRGLKIPISDKIDPHVAINDRAVARFGCCKYQGGRCVIELARRVAEGPEESCRSVLAHELIHTCYGCRDHGKRWRAYAARAGEALGYRIERVSTSEELGVAEARAPKYLLRCTECGQEFPRVRASRLTQCPERYRCRCGGRLERIF